MKRRALIHASGGCATCNKYWDSNNVQALVAKHLNKNPTHKGWYSFEYVVHGKDAH